MTAAPDYMKPDPGSSEAVADAFALLWHAVGLLSEDIPAHLDADESAEAAVRLLADVRAVHKQVGELLTFAETKAINRLSYGKNNVAGYVAEVKGGETKPGHYEHDRLAWAVIEATIVDRETGAVDPADTVVAGKVRDALLNAAAISYWRTTQLKPLGIDIGDYSERVPSKRSVILTKADGETS